MRLPRPGLTNAGLRAVGVLILVLQCNGGDITGHIELKSGTVKRSIAASVYDLRGAAIQLSHAQNERGRYSHVAVWLETTSSADVSPTHAQMSQSGRQFEPDLLIVPVGSEIDFPNLDPIFHNIFSLSRSKPFDLGYYGQGKSRAVRFSQAGVIQVYCHIHSDMYGVIVVSPTGWYTRPGSDGTFSIHDVEPGRYRIVVWQKGGELTKKRVVVPGSGSVRMSIALPDASED